MHFEKRIQIGLVMLLSGFILGCGTALYIPKVSTLISEEDLKDMLKGRAVYITKCGSCHSLVLPEKFIPGEWKVLVKRMSPKSHLTPQEEAEILLYLTKYDRSRIGTFSKSHK